MLIKNLISLKQIIGKHPIVLKIRTRSLVSNVGDFNKNGNGQSDYEYYGYICRPMLPHKLPHKMPHKISHLTEPDKPTSGNQRYVTINK